jgi:hypothetical protein
VLIDCGVSKEALATATISGSELLHLGEDQLIMLGIHDDKQRAQLLQNINDLKYYNYKDGASTHQQDAAVSQLNDCRTVRGIKVNSWLTSLNLTGSSTIEKSAHLLDILSRAQRNIATGRQVSVTVEDSAEGDVQNFEATVVMEGEVRKGKRGVFSKSSGSTLWAILLERIPPRIVHHKLTHSNSLSLNPSTIRAYLGSSANTTTSSSSNNNNSNTAPAVGSPISLPTSVSTSSLSLAFANSPSPSPSPSNSPSPLHSSSITFTSTPNVVRNTIPVLSKSASTLSSTMFDPSSGGLPTGREMGYLAILKKKRRSDTRVVAIPLSECAIDCSDSETQVPYHTHCR